jgi:hypothetical protein
MIVKLQILLINTIGSAVTIVLIQMVFFEIYTVLFECNIQVGCAKKRYTGWIVQNLP